MHKYNWMSSEKLILNGKDRRFATLSMFVHSSLYRYSILHNSLLKRHLRTRRELGLLRGLTLKTPGPLTHTSPLLSRTKYPISGTSASFISQSGSGTPTCPGRWAYVNMWIYWICEYINILVTLQTHPQSQDWIQLVEPGTVSPNKYMEVAAVDSVCP